MIPKNARPIKDQNNYVEGQKPICDTEDKILLKLLLYIFFVGNFNANVNYAHWHAGQTDISRLIMKVVQKQMH